MKKEYDIVIMGGGPAGLSAALTAARGNRSVLVIDHKRPRNAPAAHMMNFPSREGLSPAEFRDLIKKDLKKYPHVELIEAVVEKIVPQEKGFLVNDIYAKKILLAHGVVDTLPPIPGMKELFGKSIFHCPYCHGYEHSGGPIGVIAAKEVAQHMVVLVKGLTNDVILFTDGDLETEVKGVKTYTQKIEKFIYQGEQLQGVKLITGEIIKRDYLFYRFDQKLSADIGVKLGCELTSLGHYKVNELGQTSIPGIYAAGDCASPKQSVLMACASGQMAGAGMNAEILIEA